MTNNGLKISEMVYSSIEDAVNNAAQIPVSVEIGGVKGNRRVPINLITDRYVEKDPASQDPQLINSPITITPDAALDYTNPALLVKGISHVSNTGDRSTETSYFQSTATNTEVQIYANVETSDTHVNFLHDVVIDTGGPRSTDYTIITTPSDTATNDTNIQTNSNGLDIINTMSVIDRNTNYKKALHSKIVTHNGSDYNIIDTNEVDNNAGGKVSVTEMVTTTMYKKTLDYHNGAKKIDINTSYETISIKGFDIELDDKGIKDNAGSNGTSGQVLSSTGTGVAWVNQSSGGGTSISNTGNSIQTFVYAGASLFNKKNSEVISGPTNYSYNTAIAINGDFYNDLTGQATDLSSYPFNTLTFSDPAISGTTIQLDDGYDYYITLDKVNFRYDGLYASDVAPTIQLTTPITIVFRYRESTSAGAIIPSSNGSVSPYLYFEYVTSGYNYSKPITGDAWVSTSIAYTTTDTADQYGTGTIDVYAKYNYTTKKLLIMFDRIPSCRTYIKTPAVTGAFGISSDVTLDNGVFVPANTAFAVYGWPAYYPIPTIGSHYCMWILSDNPNTDPASINVPTYLGYSNTLGPSGGYAFQAGQLNGQSDNSVYIMNVDLLPHVMCKADITLIKTNAT